MRGALLPLGGAKGYALATAVEMLSAVLSGSAFGPHVNNLYQDGDPPANVGHSFILMDIKKWTFLDGYYARMEQLLEEIQAVPLVEGSEEILYPGERRYRMFLRNKKQGITLSEDVRNDLATKSTEKHRRVLI